MRKIVLIGLFGLFMASCSNGTQIEQEEVKKLEQEINELDELNHELDEIKEEGDSLESLLNDLENSSKQIDDVLRVAKTVAPKLVDDLIDQIVNHPKVAETFISMTDDAAKAIRNLVDQGKSLSEAIKQVKEVYGPLFRNSDTLPNEVYDRFLKEVTEEVGDYKPKVDGETPTPSGGSDDVVDGGTPKVDNKLPNPEDVQKER